MRHVWGVSALLLAAGDALQARFGACTVRGELSGFTRASSGHCYFTLKDADGASGTLRCAMFRRAAAMLDFAPRDGQQVELRGRVAVYEARGELQFVAESMRGVGAGALYEEFLRLKARLESEGLFDAERKRVLPAFPTTVGVVTSLGAAALRDVLTTLARRAPHVKVIVYPTPVQGSEAPPALVSSLELAARRAEVDTLILCRGGGSLEDLWAFNDERVVRAVAASPLPIVCGVGHETDVSLCDLAADLRAATPTAAAELAAPSREDAVGELATWAMRLQRHVRHRLDGHAQRLDRSALLLARPREALVRQTQLLQSLEHRRSTAFGHALASTGQAPRDLARRLQRAVSSHRERASARLDTLEQRLQLLDPRRVLTRGYAWVTDEQGRALVSARALQVGQPIRAVWADGEATAQVTRIDTPLP